MKLPEIEHGMVRLDAGKYLAAAGQPVAASGRAGVRGVKGWFAPDRAALAELAAEGRVWCADAARPFVLCLTPAADRPLAVVSAKLLVAPSAARTGGKLVRMVPLSVAGALRTTRFAASGWVVVATRSRVERVVLGEDETLRVRADAVVAWRGSDPTGFCARLGVLDLLLPRLPRTLMCTFHGPATVWFEGGGKAEGRRHRGIRA